MRISEQGISLIKNYEGFSPVVYICPSGKPTIGYGHEIITGEEYPNGIDEIHAEDLLTNDVSAAENAINRMVHIDLNQNQFDALVSLIYNIGVSAFEKSTLLKDLNTGDIQAVTAQWGCWVYGGGRVLPGLIARRAAETTLFMEV